MKAEKLPAGECAKGQAESKIESRIDLITRQVCKGIVRGGDQERNILTVHGPTVAVVLQDGSHSIAIRHRGGMI